MPKEEKLQNKVVLNFPAEYLAQLEDSFTNMHLISRSLKELYYLAVASKSVSIEGGALSGDLFSAKRLEQLAYQACDKVFNRDDSGPYDNFRNAAKQILETLSLVATSLENGEFEKELSDEEFKIKKYQINAPVQKVAEEFKSALVDAENMRQRLEKKDDEIRELKKVLKTKCDEVSEQKLRNSLVEKKAETQAKDFEEKNKKLSATIEDMKSEHSKKEKDNSDTIEAQQQEMESLRNERRDLKEKLRNTAKNEMFKNLIIRQSGASMNVMTGGESIVSSTGSGSGGESASALAQEVKMLKGINHMLNKNLEALRESYTNKLLGELEPLPKNAVQGSDELVSLKNKDYLSLMRQTEDLIKRVYLTLASIEAVNLKVGDAKKFSSKTEIKDSFYTYAKVKRLKLVFCFC